MFERVIFDIKWLNTWYLTWTAYTSDLWHQVLKQAIFDMECLNTWYLTWSVKASNNWYGMFEQVVFDMECLNKSYLKWGVWTNDIGYEVYCKPRRVVIRFVHTTGKNWYKVLCKHTLYVINLSSLSIKNKF
jgi:hypothetical protein